MAEPKIDCLPHRFVAREVIRIEIDGEHTESVTFSNCDESLLRLRDKYSPLPLSQHPTIIFYMHPETLARILAVADPGEIERIALH